MHTLEKLPLEIWDLVVAHLSPASVLALSRTCYAFRSRLLKKLRKRKAFTIEDLLEIETWPVYDPASSATRVLGVVPEPTAYLDYFACAFCLRIRLADHFSNDNLKGSFSKRSEQPQIAATRYCIDCGLKHGKHRRGEDFEFGAKGGGSGLVCVSCGYFVKDEFPYFRVDFNEKFCLKCLGVRGLPNHSDVAVLKRIRKYDDISDSR